MLRRKMLLGLGPLVLLLAGAAIAAVWLMHGVLHELEHVDTEAWGLLEKVNDLSITVNAVEGKLYELHSGKQRHLDDLIDSVQHTQQLVDEIGRHYVARNAQCQPVLEQIRQHLPTFARHVGTLATAEDPQLVRDHTEQALAGAVMLRQDTLPLSRFARDHANQEQYSLLRDFRWLALGMGVGFLLVINVSVVLLLRMAASILRPVDQLVEASRLLGQEKFDHRVQINAGNEFDELGQAYNRLAEQLQANEKHRMEMLSQIAVALNHELNNAITIIELQLRPLARQSQGDASMEKYVREIRENLSRMARTVESLKRVRRIVLTDYISGTKMLDLERSVAEEAPPEQSPASGA